MDSNALTWRGNCHVEDEKSLLSNASNFDSSFKSLVDPDGDGKVDRGDALILNRYLAGWDGYAEKIRNWDAAKINQDDRVDRGDALILNRYLAGWDGYAKYFQ